jgi:hypothetical protein
VAGSKHDLPTIFRDTGRQGESAVIKSEPEMADELGKQGVGCRKLFGLHRSQNPKIAG